MEAEEYQPTVEDVLRSQNKDLIMLIREIAMSLHANIPLPTAALSFFEKVRILDEADGIIWNKYEPQPQNKIIIP